MNSKNLIPLAIGLLLNSAQAVSIPILNHSFESPVAATGAFNTLVTNWQDIGAAGDNGVFRGRGDFGQLAAPTDGSQMAFMNDTTSAGLVQTLSTSFQADTNYSLKVDIAARTTVAAGNGATLVLFKGSITALNQLTAANTVATFIVNNAGAPAFTADVFNTFTLTATAAQVAAVSGVGQPIGIAIIGRAGTSQNQDLDNVRLLATNVNGVAYQPDPSTSATNVETDLSNRVVPGAFSWLSPDSPDVPNIVQVFGYNVYVDTNRSKVINATPASSDLLYKSLQSGGQTGTSFNPPTDLGYGITYYWRVDAIVDLASVPGTTLTEATTLVGEDWSFTAIAAIDTPLPGDGETHAALSTILTWGTPVPGLTYNVYFGTDANALANASTRDYRDLKVFSQQWLKAGALQSDRNGDNKVDFADYSLFAGLWGGCPEFKGNLTTGSFNPVGLQEATQYYWRVDAVDALKNVYPGNVRTFRTYDTLVIRQQMLAKYDSEGVPYVLNNQKLPGYNPTGDPNDILAGQINSTNLGPLENSFNQRNIGAIYPLAFCYVNRSSTHYRNANVLNRILLALDYSCRAQGKNGGFNEKVDTANGQTGYCGVTLPNGGNGTRIDGASTVMGFPFFCIGRSIVMLQNEPDFITALDTVFIDNDGNGSKDIKRRDAYKFMFDNSVDGGTGIIQCMINGKCKGGHPNQDVGALAAVQVCNEAYQSLNNGTPYLTPAQLNSHRDTVFFDNASVIERFFNPNRRNWWTDKFMILEVGHGASGYDTGYANTIPSLLGSYARHTNDPVVGNFVTTFMNGYQYFYVLDDAWNDAGYWEYRTSRRQGDSQMPLFAAGVSQPYHPGHALIYDKTLAKCAKNPSLFLNVPWSGGLESSAIGELLNHWSDPVDSDYVLPCNRPATFTYTDSEANLEVIKTGVSPTTVTWKAFNYDGATKTYTYEAP